MPKRHALWKVLVSVLSAWLMAGCVITLGPIGPLPREALASVQQVALAVGDDGVKHYAWTECSGEDATLTCVLVYSRVVMGAVVYSYGFVVPIGTWARNPDVAVSSSGDAYVVRSVCTDLNTCYDYVSMFPAVDPESVEPDSELLHSSAVKSEGPPVIEGRGTKVYAVYQIVVSGFVRMRYRELVSGASLGYVDASTLSPSEPSLGIDSAGKLHVVWIRNPVGDAFIAYSNNVGTTGNMPAADTFDGGFDYNFSSPDLALDDDDQVYLAYSINSGLNDTIKVKCLVVPANCYRGVATLTVPQVDGPWNLYRDAHIELIEDQPNVVFAATHNSLSRDEIWWYSPPSTGGNTPPDRVTTTTDDFEGEPLIVEENSGSGDVPVVGWRMYISTVAGTLSPGGFSDACWGDVFVTYAGASFIRQVFEDRGTCDNSGLDLAANGQWVAGVWVDEESDAIAAHAAWTGFNANRVNLPLATK